MLLEALEGVVQTGDYERRVLRCVGYWESTWWPSWRRSRAGLEIAREVRRLLGN